MEVRRIRRMLRRIYALAEHNSLTGALQGAAPEVTETYNRILAYLTEQGILSTPLFPTLPPDASFERVGVAARLLDGYLVDDSMLPDTRVTFPPLQEQMDDLRDLGRTIRDNLPDFLRRRMETRLDKMERAEQEAKREVKDSVKETVEGRVPPVA
jgi:hypothetical protein